MTLDKGEPDAKFKIKFVINASVCNFFCKEFL